MSHNIFVPNKNIDEKNNFKNLFGLDSTVNYSPLPSSLHIQNKIDGSIKDYDLKNLLTSEIPTNSADIDSNLLKLFGGAKNDTVYSATSDDYTNDTNSLQQQFNSLFENNVNQSGGNIVTGTRDLRIRGEYSLFGGARELPEGLKAYRKFVDHIQANMKIDGEKIKGGPKLQVFASLYKKEAAKNNPDMNSIELSKESIKLFDNDSNEDRISKYEKATKILEDKKEKKKNLKEDSSDELIVSEPSESFEMPVEEVSSPVEEDTSPVEEVSSDIEISDTSFMRTQHSSVADSTTSLSDFSSVNMSD